MTLGWRAAGATPSSAVAAGLNVLHQGDTNCHVGSDILTRHLIAVSAARRQLRPTVQRLDEP
jgi:hypothetical protein